MKGRILLLYNAPVLPASHPDYASEIEVLDTVEAVGKALADADYHVDLLALDHDPVQLWQRLQEVRPDVVFNLYEGSGANNLTEIYVANLLEWSNIPYTGCPALTLQLAQKKPLVKQLMLANNIPTPSFRLFDTTEVDISGLRWPLIVKPGGQDCSIGVSQESVVTDERELAAQVRSVLRTFGPPVLIEEFIDGREVALALVENPELRTLPMTETLFTGRDRGLWPLLTYQAKWNPESPEYDLTDYEFDAKVSPALAGLIQGYAKRLFRLLGARDSARVDIRIKSESEIYLLELNPNPAFAPGRALSNNLEMAGISHARFCVQMVQNALARKTEVSREQLYQQHTGS